MEQPTQSGNTTAHLYLRTPVPQHTCVSAHLKVSTPVHQHTCASAHLYMLPAEVEDGDVLDSWNPRENDPGLLDGRHLQQASVLEAQKRTKLLTRVRWLHEWNHREGQVQGQCQG